MSIELSEEAFALLHGLREELVRCQKMLADDPDGAEQRLTQAIADLGDWIGPGVP